MNTRTRIVLLLLLGTAAAMTRPLTAQTYIPKFEKFTLRNGMHVVLHRDTTLPLISVHMVYHAGSAVDQTGRTGVANIAGEMLLLGTKNVPREELMRLRAEEQVSISAMTTVDWFGISSVFPMHLLEKAITIEADRMQHATASFARERFDAIIENLREEHKKRETQAFGTLTQQIFHELYAERHPYRHITIGERDHLDSIRFSDVRAFSARYHVPANAYLTLAGNFDPATTRKLIERHFSGIHGGDAVGWKNIPDAFTPIGQGAIIREDRHSHNQLHLVFPTVRIGHPDEPVLRLIARLLTGSENALINMNLLRGNPLVHSVEVNQTSNELTGTFWITVNCAMEAKLSDVYGQVMRIIADLANRGAADAELNAARNQAAMEFYAPLELFHGFGGRGDMLNLGNLYGGTPSFHFTQFESLRDVSSASVKRATTQYLSASNQFIVSVVPFGKAGFGVDLE
ncbi:MAG: pitrilysin family protein [Bacteroidota bacterium]|jgi:zinc protease|nr:pitrilysin family protein [Bacteroidota bacterium]